MYNFSFFVILLFITFSICSIWSKECFWISSCFFLIFTLSFGNNILAHVCSDFTMLAPFQNSNIESAVFYKITATWSNHEGSFNLWSWFFLVYVFSLIPNWSFWNQSVKFLNNGRNQIVIDQTMQTKEANKSGYEKQSHFCNSVYRATCFLKNKENPFLKNPFLKNPFLSASYNAFNQEILWLEHPVKLAHTGYPAVIWIHLFFALFLILTSSPWQATVQNFSESILGEGNLTLGQSYGSHELNPILQDPILAIHPPCIYAGYLASGIAFALCISQPVLYKKRNIFEWFLKQHISQPEINKEEWYTVMKNLNRFFIYKVSKNINRVLLEGPVAFFIKDGCSNISWNNNQTSYKTNKESNNLRKDTSHFNSIMSKKNGQWSLLFYLQKVDLLEKKMVCLFQNPLLWMRISWTCNTLGIGLGSWWAYHELGWGGWWFWDPVENASLIPWIVSTAFIHQFNKNKCYEIEKIRMKEDICYESFNKKKVTAQINENSITIGYGENQWQQLCMERSNEHHFVKQDRNDYGHLFQSIIIATTNEVMIFKKDKIFLLSLPSLISSSYFIAKQNFKQENVSLYNKGIVTSTKTIFVKNTNLIQEKRNLFFNYRISLWIFVTFFSCILSTFFVRSGLLSSVHSFAFDSTKGFILLLLALFCGLHLLLFKISLNSK